MTPIKQLTDQHATMAQASRYYGVSQTQLRRWVEYGALVDDKGNIWKRMPGKLTTQENQK